MKYTSDKEKEKIKRVLKSFLAMRGYTLKGLCVDNNIDYDLYYQRINSGNIDEEHVNFIIKLVDKNFSLVKFQEQFQILKDLKR